MARPSSFTQEIADEICERLANGESLRAICEGEELPHMATVFRWLGLNNEFCEQYARAREAQADALADEILTIADRSQIGTKTTTKADGGMETVECDMVERSRLQIDARKWLAGKLKPKVYGDKVTQDIQGSLTVKRSVEMTDDELAAIAIAGSAGAAEA